MSCYLTIGTYDGVHRGHLKILEILKRKSLENGTPSAVVYFPVPPKFYLSGNSKDNILTSGIERAALLKACGIDRVEELIFDREMSEMRASDFFQNIIIGKYRARGLVVGRDFALGRSREGNVHFLEKICREKNVDFQAVDFVKYEEHKLSSSLIRGLLHKGELEKAFFCLSREYFATGAVIRGAGLGKKIGFPTANLSMPEEKLLPKGVFAVKVLLGNESFKGVASVGYRPTLKTLDSKLLLEAHLLDFDREIYGCELKVSFHKKIRNEIKFSEVSALVARIKDDVESARKMLEDWKNRRLED